MKLRKELTIDIPWEFEGLKDPEEKIMRNTLMDFSIENILFSWEKNILKIYQNLEEIYLKLLLQIIYLIVLNCKEKMVF